MQYKLLKRKLNFYWQMQKLEARTITSYFIMQMLETKKLVDLREVYNTGSSMNSNY